MNTTMYLNLENNSWFKQAVGDDQSLRFCVHIFDKASSRIVDDI